MRRISNYDKRPIVSVKGYDQSAVEGYKTIAAVLREKMGKGILVVECYPGVDIEDLTSKLKEHIDFDQIIFSDEIAFTGDEITRIIDEDLTDDRVFGVMTDYDLEKFYSFERLVQAKDLVDKSTGSVLIIGVGASLVKLGDVLVYADMARWEIQQRFRLGKLSNWRMDNKKEDIIKKYKRGYFFDWRIADNYKKKVFNSIDFYLDTNNIEKPIMVNSDGVYAGMKQCSERPFRVVPFFDPGVWGGQWMKEVCDLDRSKDNYAWCFDCVPEENSLLLAFGDSILEMPAINLVFFQTEALLGNQVKSKFGVEFPIRFDLLDTVGGENLSLQVHPLKTYIQENFGMQYTQDESYYILDAEKGASVYLGLKEGINCEDLANDLKRASQGEENFPVDKYINNFEAKKHDHFLIPAGTVHCSGAGTLVLEISATPYIFTFKLWDWNRVGLDGRPRPIHIDHGLNVIQFDRTTDWVKENLVNDIKIIGKGDGFVEEHTGLHPLEFIETRRHWFDKPVYHNTNGSVNVINLIEGEEIIVESPNGSFDPFVVHYAETFIVPESVGSYTIRPHGKSEGKITGTLKAYVRVGNGYE